MSDSKTGPESLHFQTAPRCRGCCLLEAAGLRRWTPPLVMSSLASSNHTIPLQKPFIRSPCSWGLLKPDTEELPAGDCQAASPSPSLFLGKSGVCLFESVGTSWSFGHEQSHSSLSSSGWRGALVTSNKPSSIHLFNKYLNTSMHLAPCVPTRTEQGTGPALAELPFPRGEPSDK